MLGKKNFKSFSTSGVQNKTQIIKPGTGGVDKYTKIHINEIDLVVSGAATIDLYLGDTKVYTRTVSAAAEIHSLDRDIYLDDNAFAPLSISVSAAVDVTGTFHWTPEYTGGPKVRGWEDTLT
jgi:hypothetical protein